MNRRRTSERTLTGSRIYIRRNQYKYFAPEPFMNPKTGKVTRWHALCPASEGELAARNALDALLGKIGAPAGKGDFGIWFGQWKRKVLADRAAKAPKEPARAAIWAKGTKAVSSQLGVIENAFVDFNVSQVESPDIAEFVDQWEGRRSAQTYRGYLKKFFAWCIRRGFARHNPANDVSVEKPKARNVLMTPEQYLAIQAGARTDKLGRPTRSGEMLCCYMDLLYLMYQRGTDVRLLKRGELASRTLPITPTKTQHSSEAAVEIPITEEIRAVVTRAVAAARVTSLYVICNAKGQPYTAHGIQSLFEDACQRANVTGVTLKDIRAMAATAAKKKGYTRAQIKVALAHTDESTTDGYIRDRDIPLSEVVLTLPRMGR
jgi:integrase